MRRSESLGVIEDAEHEAQNYVFLIPFVSASASEPRPQSWADRYRGQRELRATLRVAVEKHPLGRSAPVRARGLFPSRRRAEGASREKSTMAVYLCFVFESIFVDK